MNSGRSISKMSRAPFSMIDSLIPPDLFVPSPRYKPIYPVIPRTFPLPLARILANRLFPKIHKALIAQSITSETQKPKSTLAPKPRYRTKRSSLAAR